MITKEYLLDRIGKNKNISSAWKERIKRLGLDRPTDEQLLNFADPNGLSYHFYATSTNKIIPPSHLIYKNRLGYQRILEIREPDTGNPPKPFKLATQNVSGNFLRQAYFIFNMLNTIAYEPRLIVEIGGGYGLMAYMWKKLFPKCKVIIVDLPEAILLQWLFLKDSFNMTHVSSEVGKNRRISIRDILDVTLVEIDALKQLIISPDMVLALAVFQELTKEQVDDYMTWIQLNLMAGGHFYLYSCHALDPNGYKLPIDMPMDNKWKAVKMNRAKLRENDFHHLDVIYRRLTRERKKDRRVAQLYKMWRKLDDNRKD